MPKPLPCLQDMPPHIKEKIVEFTGYFSRFALRKVSPNFLSLVDNAPASLTELFLILYPGKIFLFLTTKQKESLALKYQSQKESESVIPTEDYIDHVLESPDHVLRAVTDLQTILKNPKLTIEEFRVYYFEDEDSLISSEQFLEERTLFFDSLCQNLQNLNHQLHVQSLEMYISREQDALSILPFIKPETIKNLSIDVDGPDRKISMEKVTGLEQWSTIERLHFNGAHGVHILTLGNVKKGCLVGSQVNLEDLEQLVEVFVDKISTDPEPLRSINLDYYTSSDHQNIWKFLNGPKFQRHTENKREWFLDVPGTDFQLNFVYTKDNILLWKAKKNEFLM